MVTYIVFINLADRGIRSMEQTAERIKAGTAAAERLGIKVKEIHWTVGAYDALVVADAPNEDAITAWVSSQGNIRMETIPTFSADEIKEKLAKSSVRSLSSCEIIQWSY